MSENINLLPGIQKRQRVMLDLSTSHLKPDTFTGMVRGDLDDYLTCVETPYGCIVYTLPTDFMSEDHAVPEELCHILTLADQCQAMLIHFDSEADTTDSLPVFEWD